LPRIAIGLNYDKLERCNLKLSGFDITRLVLGHPEVYLIQTGDFMPQTKTTRSSAIANMFYPGDPFELQELVNQYLYEDVYQGNQVPKAIIAPHAGYVYSGSSAASVYRTLLQYRHVIRKVILLGPAHHVALAGLGLPTVDQFETPLGPIKLDTKTIAKLVGDFPQVSYSDPAHADEHALEVQLPFLQTILASFRLIPFVVGDTTELEIANILDQLWGGEECLIVISSDLSHFLNYESAVQLDGKTAASIESFQGDELPDNSACGRLPIRGLLRTAQQRGMTIKRFDLRNSGDTSGDKQRVVGYGAWGLFEGDQ